MTMGAMNRRWTLLAVCATTFMLLVDITIVNVALPSIQRRLSASLTGLEWVVDAYALTLAALILTAGALADRYGRRSLFCVGVALFSAASLLCGIAWNIAVLDVARALQGIGGAALFATALALIGAEYQGAERGRAIATWGATVGLAVAAGPLLGGIITDSLGWRWIFFVNIPIGAFAIVVATRKLRESRDPDASRTDFAGLVCFSASLFLIVYALLRGEAAGWTSAQIVTALTGGLALLAAFVVVEVRQERPMLDVSLFRQPAFLGVQLATFCLGAGMFALLPFLSIYLQDIDGYSPLGAGLRFLPITAFVFLVPLATRKLAARAPTLDQPRTSRARIAADGDRLRTLAMDGATTRIRCRRDRNRARQPDDRRRRAARSRPRPHRDGIRDQQHVPGRRPRDRRSGVRGLTAAACWRSSRRGRVRQQGARSRRELLRPPRGIRSASSRSGRKCCICQRIQTHPPDRRPDRPRRRNRSLATRTPQSHVTREGNSVRFIGRLNATTSHRARLRPRS